MRLLTILVAVLAGCGPSPALEEPPHAPVEGPRPEPIVPKVHYEDPPERPMGAIVGQSGGWDQIQPPSVAESCRMRAKRLEEYQRELTIVEQEHARWVEEHCRQTVRHTTTKVVGGGERSRDPERAWICDGKHVETTESVRGQWIVVRMADLRDFLREKCDVGQ